MHHRTWTPAYQRLPEHMSPPGVDVAQFFMFHRHCQQVVCAGNLPAAMQAAARDVLY